MIKIYMLNDCEISITPIAGTDITGLKKTIDQARKGNQMFVIKTNTDKIAVINPDCIIYMREE